MAQQVTYVFLLSNPNRILTTLPFLWQPSIGQFIKSRYDNDHNKKNYTIKKVAHVSIPILDPFEYTLAVNVYLENTDIEDAEAFTKVSELV